MESVEGEDSLPWPPMGTARLRSNCGAGQGGLNALVPPRQWADQHGRAKSKAQSPGTDKVLPCQWLVCKVGLRRS